MQYDYAFFKMRVFNNNNHVVRLYIEKYVSPVDIIEVLKHRGWLSAFVVSPAFKKSPASRRDPFANNTHGYSSSLSTAVWLTAPITLPATVR